MSLKPGQLTPAEISAILSGGNLTLGNVVIAGNLTVQGTTTIIDTETLSVEDPLIEVGRNNAADLVDLGLYGKYNQAATDKYGGLFRDASDSKWKIFSDLETQPTTFVDTAGPGYTAATLVVGTLEGAVSYTPYDSTWYDFSTVYPDPVNTAQACDALSYQSAVAFQTSRNLSSTTMLSGGLMSVKNTTEITIAAGAGFIIDHTSLSGPFGGAAAGTPVSWSAMDVTITGVATNTFTMIAINSAGTVIQSATPFTAQQRREYLVLGKVLHLTGTVSSVVNLQERGVDLFNQYQDLAQSIGPLALEGNVIQPHDAANTLEMTKTAGKTFRLNYNSAVDIENPHISTEPLQDPATFFYVYRDGAGSWTFVGSQTLADPDNWDDGTGTLNSTAANKYTVQRWYMFPGSGRIYAFYGQREYNSLGDALAAAGSEDFDGPPDNFYDATLRAYVVMKSGITDFSGSDWDIISGGKFQGTTDGGGGAAAVVTEFSDQDFLVYKGTDPTAHWHFDLTNLAGGEDVTFAANASQTGDITVTMPDATGTLIYENAAGTTQISDAAYATNNQLTVQGSGLPLVGPNEVVISGGYVDANNGLFTSGYIYTAGTIRAGTSAPSLPNARIFLKQQGETFDYGLTLQRSATLDSYQFTIGGDNGLYLAYADNASGADQAVDFSNNILVRFYNTDLKIDTTATIAKDGSADVLVISNQQTNAQASISFNADTQDWTMGGTGSTNGTFANRFFLNAVGSGIVQNWTTTQTVLSGSGPATAGANEVAIGGGYIDVANDITANQLWGSALIVNGAAGENRLLACMTSGAYRWQIGANGIAESGGNVGSDFAIFRYSDAGSYLDAPLQIARENGYWYTPDSDLRYFWGRGFLGFDGTNGDSFAVGHRDQTGLANHALRQNNVGDTVLNAATGRSIYVRIANTNQQIVTGTQTTFYGVGPATAGANQVAIGGGYIAANKDVTASAIWANTYNSSDAAGTNRLIYCHTNAVPRWAFGGDATSESGANTGTDFVISRFSDAGAYVDTPLMIARDSGNWNTPDADRLFNFGRGALGYDGSNADLFCIAHRDRMSVNNWAMLQNSAGDVVVNASTGRSLDLRINNTNQIAITGAQVLISGVGPASPGANQVAIGGGKVIANEEIISYAAGISATTPASIEANSSLPAFGLYETDGGTDEKRWEISASNQLFRMRCVNDAVTVGNSFMEVTRSGATPTSVQLKATVTTANETYAEIHVHNNSTAQSIATGSTYTKCTAFTDNGGSNDATADATNDKITITRTGFYQIIGAFSFYCGTNNTIFDIGAFLGGTEQQGVHLRRKLSTGADVGSAAFSGIIDVTSVPADLDVRAKHDQGAAVNLTIAYGNLQIKRLGDT